MPWSATHATAPAGTSLSLAGTQVGYLANLRSDAGFRTNVEFATVVSSRRIDLRVWERGAGETLACGTGTCAAAVACHLNALTGREVTARLPGGAAGKACRVVPRVAASEVAQYLALADVAVSPRSSGRNLPLKVIDYMAGGKAIVATDHPKIKAVVEGFGGEAVMTSPECQSGTDRAAEVAANLDVDIVVNVQGDEPEIPAACVDDLVAGGLEVVGGLELDGELAAGDLVAGDDLDAEVEAVVGGDACADPLRGQDAGSAAADIHRVDRRPERHPA